MTDRTDTVQLLDLAEWLVSFARSKGAEEVEVSILSGTEFSVDVRNGEIESLVEAGSRQVGFRLRKDQRTVSSSSSDLTQDTLKHLVLNGLERAGLSSQDPFAGLPKTVEAPLDPDALLLYDPVVAETKPEEKIRLALETEKIAQKDKRITNSHGAGFETRNILSVLANSNGFMHQYRETFCSQGIGLQAGETDHVVEGSWGCTKRFLRDMEPPEEIAQKAVDRTVRLLHPRKVNTQNVPVIFEPSMTSWLMGFLFSCISGTAVYQKTSFLAGKLGEHIGNGLITVLDDGTMPNKLGTAPFDSEGGRTRKTVAVEKGILKNYLCNTYAARKLKLQSTGNASGGGVGPTNFFLQKGTSSLEEMTASLDKGLILTRTIGHGLNPVNGDISRGAFGLWVEKGEIVYPVSEITISGNLGTILNSIEMIGRDLDFRSAVCGPSIKVAELTVAGELH